MSRSSVAKVLVLFCLCFAVNESYAWTESLDISIPSWKVYTAPNQSVDVWAYVVSGGPVLPEGNWSWNWPPELNGTYDPYDYSSRGSFSSSFAGCYTVSANAWNNNGFDSDSAYVYVVEVAKIQYWDGISSQWVDITGTLYVAIGDHVVFKAVPNPGGAFWPSSKPVWSGSSGASGTGETVGVGFHTLSASPTDYKTVSATCGNTVTANVIVYDFQGTLIPSDNFAGRSQTDYGLEEIVGLGCNITPSGLIASQVGGLRWSEGLGKGSLSNITNNGTANYDAGAYYGTANLQLTVQSGPSQGAFKYYVRTIVAPSGTRITKATETVGHIYGFASAQIALYHWLDPTDVSFANLHFGEGSCPSTNVWGFYLKCEPWNSYPKGTPIAPHSEKGPYDITGGDITNGCRVAGVDFADTGTAHYTKYAAGGYTWTIPAQYIDDTGTRHTICTQDHVSTFAANGDATQYKGGQSGSAGMWSPTTGWY